MNILIVGAGICGSALTIAAVRAGHTVTLVNDDQPMDSLSAAAVLRRAWHAGSERALFNRTLDLYAEWDIQLLTGAVVTSYRRSEPKYDPDWRMIDPAAPLVTASVSGHAVGVGEGVVRVGEQTFHPDATLWATGRYGGEVTGVTYGVTWVHDNPDAALIDPAHMRVHHIAPYKSVMAGEVGGRARFGSSSATSSDKARQQAKDMYALGVREGIIRDDSGWYAVSGQRVKTAPNATLGGMHRTGYALAPALAERIIARIGR